MKKIANTFLSFLLAFALSSCSEKNDDPNSKMDDTARYETPKEIPEIKKDTSSKEKESDSKPLTENTPDGIKINFPADVTEVSIEGKIDGLNNVTYLLDVSKGQKLTGSIEAVSEAGKKQNNIRFSQIFTPSGQADGPFGPKIEYDLSEAGMWKLVVSENQMSGDPWTGEFKMVIGIK